MRMFKDKNNQTITFERIDSYRLLHEILVDFLGERGNKDRDKHDGLTKEHQELRKELGVLLNYVHNVSAKKDTKELLAHLTRRWEEIKE